MFSVKTAMMSAALAIGGFALVSPDAAQAGVVVKSSGPSASKYPVGTKLSDTGRITLKTGDAVTVLARGGTRVIRGPGTHRVAARGTSKSATFAALTRKRSSARRQVGAARNPGINRPNLWMVDVSRSGPMCVNDLSNVSLWRPGYEQAATYVLANGTSAEHVHVIFEEKQMITDWNAERMPLTEGMTYSITGPGGSPNTLSFVQIGDTPDNPEDLAATLLEKGCNDQAELLADSLM